MARKLTIDHNLIKNMYDHGEDIVKRGEGYFYSLAKFKPMREMVCDLYRQLTRCGLIQEIEQLDPEEKQLLWKEWVLVYAKELLKDEQLQFARAVFCHFAYHDNYNSIHHYLNQQNGSHNTKDAPQ